MRTVHFLTIGEAPRPDAVPEILGFLADAAVGVRVVEAGVLNGLTREEVRAGAPRDGEMPLVSRLRSGEEVVLSEPFVERRMARLVDRVPEGDLAAILCTGPFEGIAERRGLVKAGVAFDAALRGACLEAEAQRREGGSGTAIRVGMLIPEPRQEADARSRVPRGADCAVAVASPYADAPAAASASEVFREADLVGLNCLGYTADLEAAVASRTGKPVVLARRTLADALARCLA